jgi:hypothetical protein
VVSPVEDKNAAHAANEVRMTILGLHLPAVICVDLTEARTLSVATAETFVALMKADNAKLERSALLLGDRSATLLWQMERMVREAGSPVRRTFRDRQALCDWLLPSLTSDESTALEAFLQNAKAS